MKKKQEVTQSITTAQSGLSLDQAARQRRYFISMMIRTACFILTVLLPSPYRWIALAGALTLPILQLSLQMLGEKRSRKMQSSHLNVRA